jgi:hypothetical protein
MDSPTASPAAPDASPPARGNQTALAMLLLAVIGVAASLLIAFKGQTGGDASDPSHAQAAWSPADMPQGETVALVIDFGNGARREFDALPWQAEMTVGDLLRAAGRFRPPVRFTQQGAGATAFLTSLEGVKNETGDGRYWLYQISDRRGDVAFDLATLSPGDRVTWRYGRAD